MRLSIPLSFSALLIAGLLFFGMTVHAQPTLVWERPVPLRYGQTLSSFELPGHRFVHGGSNYVGPNNARRELTLAVTTAQGDTVRYVHLNRNVQYGQDWPTAVVLEPDYSLTYFGARSEPVAGGYMSTVFLTNLDTLGQVRWHYAYPGTGPGLGTFLHQPDGYLLLTNARQGSTPYGGITKVDLQGQVVWQRTYPSRGYLGVGQFTDIIAHPDGSYWVAGFCDRSPLYAGGSSYLRQDYWLLKLRPNGDTIATTHFGDPAHYERATALRLLPGDALALTGVQGGAIQTENPQLLRLDSAQRPHPQWTHTEPYPDQADNPYRFLLPLQSGNILVGGSQLAGSQSAGAGTQAQLLSLTPAGTVDWQVLHRSNNRMYNAYLTCVMPADGTAYLTGFTYDYFIGNGGLQNVTGLLSKYAAVGPAYQPDLCRTPPTAAFAYAFAPAADSLLLLDTSAPGPRYAQLVAWHWDFGDGTAFDGPAPPWHRYATPPGSSLRVTLTVTNNLGCQHTVALLPLAARSRQLQARLTLHPNPATDAVTVEIGDLRQADAVLIEVRNTLGQLVQRTTTAPRQGVLRQELDLRALPPGVYLVRLHTAEGTLVKRLVKQ